MIEEEKVDEKRDEVPVSQRVPKAQGLNSSILESDSMHSQRSRVHTQRNDEKIRSFTLPSDVKVRLRKVIWRWIALVLICLFTVGGYYCYDNPAELEGVIERTFDIEVAEYSLLYSVYSLPNTVLPVFGGVILDKIGYSNGLLITTFLVMIGQMTIMYGGAAQIYGTIVVGRAIFGIGTETMFVVQAVYVTNWF